MPELEDKSQHTEQPLIAHLLELRTRLIRVILGIFVFLIPLSFFSNEVFGLLANPIMGLLPKGSHLIATGVTSPFSTPFKLAAVLSFILAMPWVLYQIWAFIAPGLYKHERRLVIPLLVSSTTLFYVGIVFAHQLVLPVIFKFFVASTPQGVAMMTDISQYLDFTLAMFLAFGCIFELPVLIILLLWSGMVEAKQLREGRGYVLIGCFIIAAFLTPPDVLSQTLLAVPMYALFELGLFMGQWFVRKKV